MNIYLYGTDSYRRSARLRRIAEEFKKKHADCAAERFDLEKKDALEQLLNFTKVQSLFAKAKLGIVENADKTDGAAKILKLATNDSATVLIIVSKKKLPKEFAFLGKEPNRTEEFDELTPASAFTFVKKEADARGIKAEDTDIKNAIAAYGGDTWTVLNELEKIALGGKKESVIAAPQFFTLVQSLKNPSVTTRLSALAYLLKNEESAAVFNVLAAIAPPELKIKMANYDIAIKSGKLEYEEALTDLVIGN